MKEYLNYIKEIVGHNLKGTTNSFEDLISFFIMNEGTSNDEIEKCDLYLNKKLPDEYKFFLQNYNGGTLFKVDDHSGFKLLSNKKLINHNQFQRENFDQDWDISIILFCECIGDAEYLGFKIGENGSCQIVYCILDTLPQEWDVIESSFDDFITKLIEEKGRKYWLDS